MNDDQAHIGPFKFDFIFFNHLDLLGVNAVIIGQFLIFPGAIGNFAFLSTDIIKTVIKESVGIYGIFPQEITQILFGRIVGRRQVFCKKYF